MNNDLYLQGRIEKIVVRKLFGTYDYDIDFEELVSIIIAPNGLGKTTIFRLICAALNADYEELYRLRKVPFESFSVILSDNRIITLSRSSIDEYIKKKPRALSRTASARNYSSEDYYARNSGLHSRDRVLDMLKQVVESGMNYKISIKTAFDIEKEKDCEEGNEYSVFYFDNILERIDLLIRDRGNPIEIGSYEAALVQKRLLMQTRCFYPVNFIPADRLLVERPDFESKAYRRRNPDNNYKSRLSEAIEDMQEKVNTMVREYSLEIAKAQSELPSRYLRPEKTDYPEFSKFKEKWDYYIAELSKFSNLGFIDIKATDILEVTEEDYKNRKEFLNTYLELFSKTVNPLYRFYDKFNIFKSIFDERNELTEKEIKFTADGIKTVIADERVLENMDYLSSGEKNDFIMFYDMLFDTKENSIVLIDEPEISLHISWQDTFVQHIISIAEENKMQVVIATHSPHIVSGHFDLVKDL